MFDLVAEKPKRQSQKLTMTQTWKIKKPFLSNAESDMCCFGVEMWKGVRSSEAR